ncbi:MAG: hypothetical protein ACOYZ7_11945 [Chloroflexota bacterium]
MRAQKLQPITLTLVLGLACLLSACDVSPTPAPSPGPSPLLTQPGRVITPPLTIRQELEEQWEMLRALVTAEQGRGHDVSQAEQLLNEAGAALQENDLALARQKLRDAGAALGVQLP